MAALLLVGVEGPSTKGEDTESPARRDVTSSIQTNPNPAADATSLPKGEGSRAGEERDNNGLKVKLIWCPSGKFTMGSPPTEKGRDEDEDQVKVVLTGFWIGKFEVTQREWEALMGTSPWKEQV